MLLGFRRRSRIRTVSTNRPAKHGLADGAQSSSNPAPLAAVLAMATLEDAWYRPRAPRRLAGAGSRTPRMERMGRVGVVADAQVGHRVASRGVSRNGAWRMPRQPAHRAFVDARFSITVANSAGRHRPGLRRRPRVRPSGSMRSSGAASATAAVSSAPCRELLGHVCPARGARA
jgi:hypothetical protein